MYSDFYAAQKSKQTKPKKKVLYFPLSSVSCHLSPVLLKSQLLLFQVHPIVFLLVRQQRGCVRILFPFLNFVIKNILCRPDCGVTSTNCRCK